MKSRTSGFIHDASASRRSRVLPVLADSPDAERFLADRARIAGRIAAEPDGHAARRAILLLAIPMVLEMVMESVFAVADIFWVSKLGADAVATVGLTESLLTIIYAVSMGFGHGHGCSGRAAHGPPTIRRAGRAAVQAVLLGFGLAVVFGVVGASLAPHLLALLGASPAVLATGVGFTRIMLGGSVTIVLLFMINAAFRGAGDAAITLRTLWLAKWHQHLLGPILVFGLGSAPRLGRQRGRARDQYRPAASASFTTLDAWPRPRALGHSPPAGSAWTALPCRPSFELARSGVLQMLIGMSSWIGLVRILAAFGSSALAGYTIAMRVVMFMLLPSWGLGNAPLLWWDKT